MEKTSYFHKALIVFSMLAFGLLSGQTNNIRRETVLDKIVHIEDSIYSSIPTLPRLCDAIQLHPQKVDIGGCRLHVEIEGKGTSIVLINGGPGGTHHYFHPWFSELKKKHKIIYYDQRGTGQSDFNPNNGYSFIQAVNDLEKLRKQLGVGKWIVCGYSYGGGLAQLYTATYPENVRGMVLVSALPGFKDEKFKSSQQQYISQAERDKMKEVTRKAVDDKKKGKLNMNAFLYNMAVNGDWKRQSFYKPTKEQMIRSVLYEWVNDRNFNNVMSKSVNQYNFKGLFNNCPVPTLILEGKQDLTWGNKKAEIFRANHPNATYVLFEHSGHSIFQDESKKFMTTISKFSKKIQLPSKESIDGWKKEITFKIQPKE